MNIISIRKYLITISILAQGLTATTVSATWYVNQSESYYKPNNYHNEKYGDFVPANIQQKLFGHLNVDDTEVESKALTVTTPTGVSNNQIIAPHNQQTSNQTRNVTQQYQQPAYNRYNQNKNYTSAVNQRGSRNTNFNGPWSNNGSNFSGPWNNNGSNFNMPWGNNRGNNNGSSFSPFGNGGGWGW